MTKKKLRVAMIAPPWLALPVKGYGGIELVIESLVTELKAQGVDVELFANGARTMHGIKTHAIYDKELYHRIDDPYYDAPLQAMQAHLQYSLDIIEKDGGFDIIHDHNPYIGPSFFSLASRIPTLPPVLHTFHGPPFLANGSHEVEAVQLDNTLQLRHMHLGNLFMVCISRAMSKQAPEEIREHLLPAVHNALELDTFPFVEKKDNYYITLARFTKDKGQHVAVKFAAKYKKRLRMAGTVAGMGTNRKLLLELSNPLSPYRKNEEFRYYSDRILQYALRYPRITYTGNISGRKKMRFISRAKALLFPIDWDEPFGMAVIEALACGTPVVAMNRGAMPEIIKHGVNGFLANTEAEFFEYANRVDEINPADCRKSVEKLFSAELMAKTYVKRYLQVLDKTKK